MRVATRVLQAHSAGITAAERSTSISEKKVDDLVHDRIGQ